MSLLPPAPEAKFLRQVLQLARLCGWRSYHARPGRTARGWRTPVQGDGAGFPDLVLVRAGRGGGTGRVVYAELKADGGRLRADQRLWLDALRAAGQEVYVWKPRDFDEIERILA